MRRRTLVLVSACLLLAAGTWLLWLHGRHPAINTRTNPSAPLNAATTVRSGPAVAQTVPFTILSTNNVQAAAAASARAGQFRYRLSNTARTIGELVGDRQAILLENALIDTGAKLNLSIPKQLQAPGDPGAYIVQARGPINNGFRAMLAASGAQIVSYIPNNAYLVRAPADAANGLAGNPLTQAVIPYEPYYKISSSMPVTIEQKASSWTPNNARPAARTTLLALAVAQKPLPAGTYLTLGLFNAGAAATVAQIETLGGRIVARDNSPFGPVVRVQPPADWIALAALPGVQIVEPFRPRVHANDLSRATVGVAADTQTTTNYMNLSGLNVLVAVDDSGIDATHPDLTGRVFGSPITDTSGHGTHVAGIIAGNGSMSSTVTNAQGSIMPGTNTQFRGMAPLANLLSLDLNAPDQELEEAAALTNALISNNSWNYGGDSAYDLAAASYDAAVRDALPQVTGSQPVLFVFSAGNEGNGDDTTDPGSGTPDSIDSPGTAKNVITVGAIQEFRNITNEVTNVDGTISAPWQADTSTDYRIAGFSSRGNVGIGTEGTFGRYKPDVVAPGTSVVSTRSQQWDINSYFYQSPTNFNLRDLSVVVQADTLAGARFPRIPTNTVQVTIQLFQNGASPVPFPDLPIYYALVGATTYSGPVTNQLSIPPDGGLGIPDILATETSFGFFYAISNVTSEPINFDIELDTITTNSVGNYFLVYSNLDQFLGTPNPNSTGRGPYYRYETGTSMSAADVSGVLALMQDYFTNTLKTVPSPALLKAMLIAGARPTGAYDLQVQNNINFEGWGLVHLPNSLPLGVTNVSGPSVSCSSFFIDQNPTNALATGDSHTFLVTIATNTAAQTLPLRVTLAWTDPPGDPAAAIKLVNSLALVVTNLDDPTNPVIYYGNDIGSGSIYNTPEGTNTPPIFDNINNVENVFISQPLGQNYSITVIGRDVNVNAVTVQTNTLVSGTPTYAPNVVQDFALVIACGEGEVSNAITKVIDNPVVSNPTTDQQITDILSTNTPLLNQFAGASTPLLGTNTVAPGAGFGFGANAIITLGMTNQWHFYVVTNLALDTNGASGDVTNAAFITFLPDTLSIPRMGVFAGSTANATRPEADIDMYVTTDPNLLTLSPITISNCVNGPQVGQSAAGVFNGASLGRGGTEFVVDTASQHGQVYYIGVYSEDQMAAEYDFLSVFTATPFSQMQNGNQLVNGINVPINILDGSTAHPGIAYVFGLAIFPMEVGQVVVNDSIVHQNFGDLIGTLNHNDITSVLNNHDSLGNPPGPYNFTYDDSGSGNDPGSQPSDGPGSLQQFAGTQGIGPWMLQEADTSLTQTGYVASYNLTIMPHKDLTKGINVVVAPNSWSEPVFIDVPAGYTNLTVSGTNVSVELLSTAVATPPLELFTKLGFIPTAADTNDEVLLTNCLVGTFPTGPDPGNSISIGPPLTPGRYWVRVFNPSSTEQEAFLFATLSFSASAISTLDYGSGGSVPILDDAVTYNSIFVPNTDIIQDFTVGLLISHPRISDLVFHLIAPDGTRYLLMENRGGTSTNGAGLITLTTNVTVIETNMAVVVTNVTVASENFESVAAGDYASGKVGIWTVTTNQVSVVTDPTNANGGNNFLALASGRISYTLPPQATSGVFTLSFAYRGPGIVSLWSGENNANDSISGNNGTISGTVTYTNGVVGQTFRLYGNASGAGYVPIPSSSSLNVGTGAGYTVEGWVNPSSYFNGQGPIIEWDSTVASSTGDSLQLYTDVNGRVYSNVRDLANVGYPLGSAGNLVHSNSFQHVAVTYDKNSGWNYLYLNGSRIASQNIGSRTLQTTYPANLGKRVNSGVIGNGQIYNGLVDELSLYQRALSASEIRAIYAKTNAGKFDPAAPSVVQGLAEAAVNLTGASPITLSGVNNTWQTYSTSGTVGTSGAVLTITGLEPGMLLDSFALTNVTITTNIVPVFLNQTNVVTNTLYLTFTEDTNLTTTPIKFAPPPFTPNTTATNAFADGFEQTPAGDYTNGQTFGNGWTVTTNQVSVVTDPTNAYEGTNFLALASGVISNNLPTVAGQTYTLSFAYRGPGIVSLWRGENNANDSISGYNGTFRGDPRYTNGVVGQAFQLTGGGSPTSARITVPDNTDFILTNQLTIEGWAWSSNYSSGQGLFFFRGDDRLGLDSYMIFLDDPSKVLYFRIQQDNTASGAADLTYNFASSLNQWVHLAGTWDGRSGVQRLYVNGAMVAQQVTSVIPLGNLDPTVIPGIGIGNNQDYGAAPYNAPWHGYLDEMSIYHRALSASEVKAIYQKGSAGKFDPNLINTSPSLSLAEAQTSVNGQTPNIINGNNTNWQVYTTTFTATQNGTPLQIAGLEPGMLLDDFTLTGMASNLYYLPEESMQAIDGQSAYGWWTLEIQDDRAGATNNAALLGWQLGFTFANTNVPTVLPGGQPLTNTVCSNNIAWYLVTVPANAVAATNILLFASAPVNVWYSANNPPTTNNAGDVVLIPNSMSGSYTLNSSSTPALVPGGTYCLGVQDTSGSCTTYAIEVDFELMPSLGGGGAQTNTVCTNSITWYQVDVPTNAIAATNLLLFATAPVSVWYSTNNPPTTNNPGDVVLIPNSTGGSYTLNFSSTPALVPGGTYYLGVQDTNGSCTTYAIEVDFDLVTNIPGPFAFTQPANAVTGTSAQLNGMATPNLLPATAWFEWGATTLYGNQTPPVNVGTGSNVVYTASQISGLLPNVPYHFRLVVSNVLTVVHGFDQILDEANVVVWGANYAGQAKVPSGLSNVVAIAGAYDHSLALKTNETAVAWGDNLYGEATVPAGLSNVVAVAGGESYSLALQTNGTVAAWGSDIYPGAGETNVPAGLTNVVMIASGQYSSLALQASGLVTAWGASLFNPTNIPAGLSNVVAIAGGTLHNLAIKNDGTVVAWGDNGAGQTNVPANLTNVVAIAAGSFHSLALKSDGTVVAWGFDSAGQTNVPANLTNVVAVAAGGFHSMALKNDGSVVAWGDDSAGQTSVPLGLSNVVAIASGYLHSMALTPLFNINSTNPIVVNATNGVPQTNSIFPGGLTFYKINVPTNADFATNRLLFALNGPLNIWFDTNTPPTTNVFLFGGTNGSYTLLTTGVPPLVPGSTYYLGVQNTNSVTVSYAIEVDFHLVTPPNPISISSIVATNIGGTFGFLLTWYAPTNDIFMVQWTGNLTPPATWNTFSNIISYTSLTPTNGIGSFEFFDDGSQTGGFGPMRFYRLVLLQSLANGVPQTNTLPAGGIDYFMIHVPANADFATNLLLSATGPVNLQFNQTTLPTGTNAGDYTLLAGVTNGLSILSTTSVPTNIVPGGTYWLGVQNTNSFAVTFSLEVDFHLQPAASLSISSITFTSLGGTNGFLLTWFAPSNDLFQVRWTPGLVPTSWTTFTNVISYNTSVFTSPTNTQFNFFDDGSQTGGFGPMRFYRLIFLEATNTLMLPFQANQTLVAPATLVVTNTAADSNTNLLLAYSLQTAPASAAISPSGIISWSVTTNQSGTINTFTTVVTDNGVPPLSATNTFTVNVSAQPVAITSAIVTTNGNFQLQWIAPTNYQFQVAWTTNLISPVAWTYIPPSLPYITAVTTNFTFVDTNALTAMKFYRLVEYP